MGKILVTLGGVVVILLFAALVAPYFIDWNHYKSEIESRSSAFFGRSVHIDGQIVVRLLPQPVLRLHGVRIDGAGNERFFEAEAIEARLAIEPLLKRNIQMTHIELVKPVLTLIRGKRGIRNWKPDTGQTPILAESDRVSVQNLHIQDGRILYQDKTRNLAKSVTRINADLNAMSLRGPFKISGVFGESDSDFKIATSRLGPENGFRLTGRMSGDFGEGRLSGVFQNVFDNPAFEGKLGFRRKKNRVNRIALSSEAQLFLADDILKIREITGTLGEGGSAMRFGGALSLDWRETLRIAGAFSARRADLDALLGRSREEPVNGVLLKGLMNVRPGGVLDGMRGVVDFSVSGGLIGGKSFSDLELQLESVGDGFRLKKLEVVLPGQSKLEIAGEVEADGEGPAFEGMFKLDTPDLRRFLNWSGYGGPLVPARGALRLLFASRIRLTSKRVEFIESSGKLGDAGFKGAFAHDLDIDSWKLEASVDALDLDRYLVPGKGVIDSSPLAVFLVRPSRWIKKFPALLRGKSDLAVKIGALIGGKKTYNDFEADLRFNNGDLAIHRISYKAGAQESVKMSGNIANLGSKPQTYMQINLAADSLSRVVPMTVIPDLPELERVFSGLGSANLDLQFTGVEDAKRVDMRLRGRGELASSKMQVEAAFSGVPERPGDGQISWRLQLENASARALLDQLHIPEAGAAWKGNGDKSRFEWNGKGTINLLLPFSARLYLPGAAFTLKGAIEKDKGYRFSDVRLNLKVEDSARLRERLTGRPASPAPVVPLTLTASLDGGKDDLVIAGASGAAGGAPYTAYGRVKLGGDYPEITLNLKPGRFDLPLLLGFLFDAELGAGDNQGGGGLSSAVLDAGRLHHFSLDLDLETPQLYLGRGLSVRRASLNLQVGAGSFEIQNLSGELMGASLRASLRLEDDGNGILQGRAGLAVSSLPLKSVFQGKGRRDVLLGLVSGKVELETRGRSLAGLVSALSGSGEVQMTDAEILLPDLFASSLVAGAAQNADELENAMKNSIGWRLAHYKTGPLRLRVVNGVLHIGKTPFVLGGGKGEFNVRADLLGRKLEAKWLFPLPDLKAAPQLGVSYSGPFPALDKQVDFSALKRYITGRRIEREARDSRKAATKTGGPAIPAGLIKQKVSDLPGLSGAVPE